jgi:hypothetical protein
MPQQNNDLSVMTGKVRLSYVHVFEPYTSDPEENEPRYSAVLIIPKSDKKTISALRNLDKNPEYEGCWYMNVSSKTRPAIADRAAQPILDQTEVYSGCYARVKLGAFAFAAQGSKGVSFGLNGLQKLADGEPLGAVAMKAEDFEAVEDDEDEDESALI